MEKETQVEETEKDSVEETSTQESVEEQITKLREEVEAAKSLAREKDEGFKTLQRKYDRLYKQKQPEPQKNDSSKTIKKLADEIEHLGKDTYSDDPSARARMTALKTELAELERQEAYNARLRQQEQLAREARDNLEDKIRDAGLEPDDEKFDAVWTSWELASLADGKFERAEDKLTRILSRIKPKETEEEEKKPVETEAQMRERLEREILEKHGLTKPEKKTPSGLSADEKEIRKRYRENPNDKSALADFLELQSKKS